ncbi:MAG: DUF881 domain-containing protein [Actinobacteria bacterium]|nr:DUF881 domain-containing protein [Actinomycetota bacterium]MBV9256287.1 DUF881 domain-containing protein [Actinomycetota bacterium]MBV9935633.1 DUF881 domain-containing protein [Actinomycetota bacterium]
MTRRVRPALLAVLALMAFIVVVAVQSRPANPETRLPRRFRLAGLIERQQATTRNLQAEVNQLHRQVNALVKAGASQARGASDRAEGLSAAERAAGLVAVRGPGLRVSLDDSLLSSAPSGNVNDLVIHSQDVQAVVNALWRAGAEAMAINNQRLTSTSAVLCVGNTLLLNGTVHSPPYVVTAVGAVRDRFDADPLVRRLRSDAESFGLRISVDRQDSLLLPAFTGATSLRYARPA